MKNHLYCSVPVCLILLEFWGALAAQCHGEKGCVCDLCPAGQEPMNCGEFEGSGLCRTCPAGTFSDTSDTEPCRPHTSCRRLNRWVVSTATSRSDAVCGECLPGFNSAATLKSVNIHACVKKTRSRRRRTVGQIVPSRAGGGSSNSSSLHRPEEKSTEYAVFALVPVFCVMGLLGILICNLLKKKGYRCISERDGVDEESAISQKEGNISPYIDDPNEDTISILVRLITEKKENAVALEELLLEYENKLSVSKGSSIKIPALPHFSQLRPFSRLCSHQHHLHTVNGLASRSGLCCSRCSQRKWTELLLPALPLPTNTHNIPAELVKSPLPGGLTVLSVGRFQVAQIPEMKSVKEVTQTEPSDTDSVDSSHADPAEERFLLGVSSSSNSASSKGRQEIIT